MTGIVNVMVPLTQIVPTTNVNNPRMLKRTCVLGSILLTPAIGRHVTVADLIGQPLKVLGQVSVLVAIGDDLDALVQHVITQLLELAHILPSHKHEVLEVRLMFNRLQEQSLEGCVIYCAPAAEKHKGLSLIQLLDLTLPKPPVIKCINSLTQQLSSQISECKDRGEL